MMAASYICNRIPHSALNMETPYEKLYGKDADPSHFKIIGVRAFVSSKHPNKLATRRAASVRPRATPTASRTQKRVA